MNQPWISILIRPRSTVREIVDTRPAYFVLLIAALTGAVELLSKLSGYFIGFEVSLALGIGLGIAIGAILGILFLYFLGWIYRWVGSWMGGQARSHEVRAAVAWAKIPILFIGLPAFLLFLAGPRQNALQILFAVGIYAAGFWAFILTCKTLGEVHRFSGWKGLGTILIGNILFVIPIAAVGVSLSIVAPGLIMAKDRALEAEAVTHLRAIHLAAEQHRIMTEQYPRELMQLIEDGALLEVPFREILGGDPYKSYQYRFQKGAAPANPFPIEAERINPTRRTAKILSIDESGRIYADGKLRD